MSGVGAIWAEQVPVEVVLAYRSVFLADREDVRIVMAHLAGHCGFYRAEIEGQVVEALNYRAGLRAAFAPIFEAVNLSAERVRALEGD